MKLESHKKNIYSQFGEDGIIEQIFNRIDPKAKDCVEFGAWDGKHFSNTCNLWTNLDWNAILIEGDRNRFENLKINISDFPKVVGVNKYVESQGHYSLDNILSEYSIPVDFDLLSIDIDGDDYYIFKYLKKYKPKLVIIEYNPTFPPHLEAIQKKGGYLGSSALSIVNLARKKGYKLATCTDTNLFLISNEYFGLLKIDEPNLSEIFPTQYLRNVIESYGGEKYLSHPALTYSSFFKLPQIRKWKRKLLNIKIPEDRVSKNEIEQVDNRIIPIDIIDKS